MQEDILQRFKALNVWKSHGKRAPHKPLLACWAIGRCLRGEARFAPYELVDQELASLLERFGPRRKITHTEDPFWRMQFDGVWEVTSHGDIRQTASGGAFKADLKRFQAQGGLRASDYIAFQNDSKVAVRIAHYLVASHFPPTLHDEILEATSIPDDTNEEMDFIDRGKVSVLRRRRSRDFRRRVLAAYDNKCAVCEFAVRRGNTPLALEAAHIKWHEARGPDEPENGLALCVLHHSLFDSGAFTLLPELRVIVARDLKGMGMEPTLGQFHGTYLKTRPKDGFSTPAPKYLAWHHSEVFKEPFSLK